MGKTNPKSPPVPRELEGSATQKDVHDLEERIGKSYSAERYEDFQEAVKKIVLETIGSEDGSEKIKKHAKEYFKGQVVWVVFVWFLTVVGALLVQKLFHVLG